MSVHISDFINDNLANLVMKGTDDFAKSEKIDTCHRCGHPEGIIERGKDKNKEIICAACALFAIPIPTYNESKALTVKQKETFFIISPKGSTVLGDVTPRLFNTSKTQVIEPTEYRKNTDKGWRGMLAEYILFEHEKKAPSLVVIQSKADKSDTFAISHSPDFVTICGMVNQRINAKHLRQAYEIIEDIPQRKWQEALSLKERNRFENLSPTLERKLNKYRDIYPALFDHKNESFLPLPRSYDFYLLGWAQ